MSHFTVLVIGENPEKQLAPFQENNMGDYPKEYLKYRVWDEEGNGHWFNSEEEFKKSGIKTEDDEDGYWENPNKKWDWYQLGGRWSNFFKLKNSEGHADSCLKKDIDLEYMRSEVEQLARKKYNLVISIIDGESYETWEQVRERFDDIADARKFYHSQPVIKRWNDSKKFSFRESPSDFQMTIDEYVKSELDEMLTTFAVIKDGKWYERGEMGWWAFVSNENDNWNEEFTKMFDAIPDDTLVSVYDCHI